MNKLPIVGIVGIAAVGMTIAALNMNPPRKIHHGPLTPVLVELFTSEGCSSCPSADKLLQSLQKDQPVDGALIIPLSEHVDYWDNASWADRFSSPKFSLRQAEYVHALDVNGSYTPQMVVNGRYQFVGSDEGSAKDAIAKAANAKPVPIELSSTPSATSSVNVKVSVPSLPVSVVEGGSELFIAITEDNLGTEVRGGENEGRRLSHTAVVRLIKSFGVVNGAANVQENIALNPNWKRSNISIVAFIQGHRSRRILGSAITQLPG